MCRLKASSFFILLTLVFAPCSAWSAEGGYSNYVPGTYGDFGLAIAPQPGLLLRNDIYYYSAEESTAVLQGRIQFGIDLDLGMNMLTALYTTEQNLLGAAYSFGTVVPIVGLDLSAESRTDNSTRAQSDEVTDLGDIALVPILLNWTREKFHFSLIHIITTPTGDYDKRELANAGLNYWSFDTSAAFTWLDPDTGREISANLGYIFNTENSATNYQSGKEIHADYMFNQYLSDTFAIGIHGFFLDQITSDGGSGAELGGFKAEAAGIGPAVYWSPKIAGKRIPLIFKWLYEFHAENRLEGDHLMASFVIDF